MDRPVAPQTDFDDYAHRYDDALDAGLAVTGENSAHFARGRVAWLKRCLERLEVKPRRVLDYGCGVGASTQYFLDILNVQHVTGVDVSQRSIETAARTWGSERASFSSLSKELSPTFDLAFCNGVFHHIPLAARLDAVRCIHRALVPGGLFAFWENNPWNPGTRLVMRRLSFDRDAITIAAPAARRLLRSGGFEILSTHFMFVFPSFLAWLRPLEPWLAVAPLGGQYQVLARKALQVSR